MYDDLYVNLLNYCRIVEYCLCRKIVFWLHWHVNNINSRMIPKQVKQIWPAVLDKQIFKY